MWRWDQAEPFGSNPADENPGGLGTFDLPLRLPGQYFDAETNLHYNYFRDYDPSLGRYIESDRMGIIAGLNTFAYAYGGPMIRTDFYGLIGNAPKDGLDPLIACKLIERAPVPDICVSAEKCFDRVNKALTKCNLQYWTPKKKIACITCWRYIEGLCPGLSPGPECDGHACYRPKSWQDVTPEV